MVADGLVMDPAESPAGESAPESLLNARKQRLFDQFAQEKATLKYLYLPYTIMSIDVYIDVPMCTFVCVNVYICKLICICIYINTYID
jgi:hypothetical protein